jgi:hypothetical protein
MTTIRTAQQRKALQTVKQLAIILTLTFSGMLMSCNKDKDEEVKPMERIPFLGSYKVIDKNNNNGEGTFQFRLEVGVSSKGADKVDLKGFRYVNNGVYATIKGNKMTISQLIEDSNERVDINGEGTLEGNTLTYSYILKYKQKGKQERVYENSAIATRIE